MAEGAEFGAVISLSTRGKPDGRFSLIVCAEVPRCAGFIGVLFAVLLDSSIILPFSKDASETRIVFPFPVEKIDPNPPPPPRGICLVLFIGV